MCRFSFCSVMPSVVVPRAVHGTTLALRDCACMRLHDPFLGKANRYYPLSVIIIAYKYLTVFFC